VAASVPANDERDLAIDAMRDNKEKHMLRTFAAALLATTLIAGPALAAQSGGGASAAPATTVPSPAAKQTEAAKPAPKTAKHVRKHARKHVAHVAKPGKVSAKVTKSKKPAHAIKTAKLPATQNVSR